MNTSGFSYSVPMIMLTILLSSYYQATLAQLEIPEAKPVDGPSGQIQNGTVDTVLYEDLGYTIQYPTEWEILGTDLLYALSAFLAPDDSTFTIKFIPAEDTEAEDIEELGELFSEDMTRLGEFYMNSTITLAGLPAFIMSGIQTYTPTVFEALEGKTGFTSRVYQVWGYSEQEDGFYGLLYSAPGKSQYDNTLPVAKQMIDSFTVDETRPVIQDSIEDTDIEEPDDTFVGSAGDNDEENEEQDDD